MPRVDGQTFSVHHLCLLKGHGKGMDSSGFEVHWAFCGSLKLITMGLGCFLPLNVNVDPT